MKGEGEIFSLPFPKPVRRRQEAERRGHGEWKMLPFPLACGHFLPAWANMKAALTRRGAGGTLLRHIMISFTNISGAEEIGANCYLLEMDGTGSCLTAGCTPRGRGWRPCRILIPWSPIPWKPFFKPFPPGPPGNAARASGEAARGGSIHDARRSRPV